MARKSIVEATSQIMGQKEINHLADDRGPNDLERRIDEQDKTISHLKHDNKTLTWGLFPCPHVPWSLFYSGLNMPNFSSILEEALCP